MLTAVSTAIVDGMLDAKRAKKDSRNIDGMLECGVEARFRESRPRLSAICAGEAY